MDTPSGWRIIEGGGELEPRVVGHVLEDRLHRALAECGLADDHTAVVVLDRAGDDFRCRGASAVDKHHEPHVRRSWCACRLLYFSLLGILASGLDDDHALAQEFVRHLNGRGEQAAGIVAKVENNALDLGVHERLERGVHFVGGFLCEPGEFDIADTRLDLA